MAREALDEVFQPSRHETYDTTLNELIVDAPLLHSCAYSSTSETMYMKQMISIRIDASLAMSS